MHIKSISARNLKGQSFTHELAPITVITGPNFSGKTARAAAIRLLLLDHIPEIGKTNQATFGLASGLEMAVSATLSDGRTLARSFKLKGNSVKAEVDIPPDLEKIGALATMLDPTQYFALSDRERVAYVFKQVKISDDRFSVEAIHDRLIAAVPGSEEMVDRLLERCSANATQDMLEQLLGAAVEEEKSARAAGVRMQKTAEGTTQLNAGTAQGAAPRSVEEAERLRAAAQAELEQLIRRESEINRWLEDARRARDIRAQIDRAESPAQKAALDEEKAKLEYITEKLKLSTLLAGDHEARTKLGEQHAKKSEEAKELSRQLQAAKLKFDAATKRLTDISQQDHCPYCHAEGVSWRDKVKTELEAEIRETEGKLMPLAEDYARAFAEATKLQNKLRDMNDAVVVVQKFERDEKAVVAKIAAMNQVRATVTALRSALEQIAEKSAAEIEAAREEIRVERQRISTNLASLSSEIKAAHTQQAELQRIAQAQKERDAAEKDQAIARGLADAIREITGELVASAFEPILSTANAIFGSILRTPIALQAGEIGTMRNGVWVTHKAMSGTEQALIYAAISAALASQSPIRLMIIDELGRLDKANAQRLGACVGRAIDAGHIDQFIGIDTRGDIYSDIAEKSFKLIEIPSV